MLFRSMWSNVMRSVLDKCKSTAGEPVVYEYEVGLGHILVLMLVTLLVMFFIHVW